MELGIIIRERREALEVTQHVVAELSGISVNTLSAIETGRANPTVDVVQRIAEVLGLELILRVKHPSELTSL